MNDNQDKLGEDIELTDKDDGIIYVNIGWPFSSIPIVQKVRLVVLDGETPAQRAKLYRKSVSESLPDHGFVPGTNFKPSELYYEIYRDPTNSIPFAMSNNSPINKRR